MPCSPKTFCVQFFLSCSSRDVLLSDAAVCCLTSCTVLHPCPHLSPALWPSRLRQRRPAGGGAEGWPVPERLGGQREPGEHSPAERHARDPQVQEEVQLGDPVRRTVGWAERRPSFNTTQTVKQKYGVNFHKSPFQSLSYFLIQSVTTHTHSLVQYQCCQISWEKCVERSQKEVKKAKTGDFTNHHVRERELNLYVNIYMNLFWITAATPSKIL